MKQQHTSKIIFLLFEKRTVANSHVPHLISAIITLVYLQYGCLIIIHWFGRVNKLILRTKFH